MNLVQCRYLPGWYGIEEYFDGNWAKPNPLFDEMIAQECVDF